MIVGVPTEVKDQEHRVALTPAGARELTAAGHRVLVQAGAGEGSAISDDQYHAAGAEIVGVEDVWSGAELILKVKEPIPSEFGLLSGEPASAGGSPRMLFTYLAPATEPQKLFLGATSWYRPFADTAFPLLAGLPTPAP